MNESNEDYVDCPDTYKEDPPVETTGVEADKMLTQEEVEAQMKDLTLRAAESYKKFLKENEDMSAGEAIIFGTMLFCQAAGQIGGDAYTLMTESAKSIEQYQEEVNKILARKDA